MTTIGWLGTGKMGIEMATRLLNDGTALTVWNRTPAKVAPLTNLGAAQAEQMHDLGRCDVVFTTITSSEDLIEVTLGDGGLFTAPTPPRIVVDCSTVSVEAAAQVRAEAAARDIGFLSAPLSGNPDMIAEGSATIVASGPKPVFDMVERYLRMIAPRVVYCGAEDEARLIKLCHNLMLGVVTQALAEATTLAEKGGVSASTFVDFLDGSVLGCTHIRHKGHAIRSRNFEAAATTENLRKDFDLGLAAARSLEVPMPAGALTHQLLQAAVGLGYGKSDYVSLYEVAAAAAGLPTPG